MAELHWLFDVMRLCEESITVFTSCEIKGDVDVISDFLPMLF